MFIKRLAKCSIIAIVRKAILFSEEAVVITIDLGFFPYVYFRLGLSSKVVFIREVVVSL